jgi:hypothetical protein
VTNARRKRWLRAAIVAAIVLALATRQEAVPSLAASDPAAALIARARVALGPGLGRVKSLYVAGTFNSGDVNGTTASWVDLTDGRFATYVKAGPLTEAFGYDGHSGWRSDSKGVTLPQTGPLAKIIAANESFDNSYALFSPNYGGATVSYLGTRSDAGKTYEAVSVKPKGSSAEEVWYDPATALPARVILDYGARTITTRLSGYRRVHGLMLSAERTNTSRWEFRDFYGYEQNDLGRDSSYKYTTLEADVDDLAAHLGRPSLSINDVSLPSGESRLPFMMRGFWIIINVKLNGKGPYPLMLDSGGVNILSHSIASEIGAPETGRIHPKSSIPGIRDERFVRVASVGIGGATLTNQDFVVGHIGNVFTRYGMIGFELFERFITTIDYANKQIILQLPGHALSSQLDPAGQVSLPLMFDDTKPEIDCEIAGVNANCVVDTGAAVDVLLSGPFAKANSTVQPPWYAGAYARVIGGGGASEVRYGPVSSFQLGPYIFSNVNTLFTTHGNGALALYLSALVGNRIWRRFTVIFDYSHSTLRLVPNASFNG